MISRITLITIACTSWIYTAPRFHAVYHGCSKHQYINFLVNTYLDAHIHQRPLHAQFLKLRPTHDLYPHSVYNIQRYINKQNIDDHDETYQNHLLATSPAAPSSDDLGIEDALHAAYNNASITEVSPQYIIDQYKNMMSETDRNHMERITQYHIHNMYTHSSRTGVLLRIAIDRSYTPACIYLARPCGTPAYCNMPGADPNNVSIRNFMDLYHTNQFEAVQTYCASSHRNALRACKTLQTRILLQKRLFEEPGYITIQAYHDIPDQVISDLRKDIAHTFSPSSY